jgi:hypothetical protein
MLLYGDYSASEIPPVYIWIGPEIIENYGNQYQHGWYQVVPEGNYIMYIPAWVLMDVPTDVGY